MCTHVGRGAAGCRYLPNFPWDRVSHWTGSLITSSASLAAQQTLGSTCLCPPSQHWVYSFLRGCWGLEPGTSCEHSSHFYHWSSLPAPSFIFINVLFEEQNGTYVGLLLEMNSGLTIFVFVKNFGKYGKGFVQIVFLPIFMKCQSIFVAKTFFITFNFKKWWNRLSIKTS